MKSVTTKEVLRCNITVLSDIYGKYNRKIQAHTPYGLIEGVVTEKDTLFAPLGDHKNILIQIETFYSGTRLVSKLLPDIDV